jgi:hypothetical protein
MDPEIEYRVMGSQRGKTEELDAFDNEAEARNMLAEYRMAFGYAWNIWLERIVYEGRGNITSVEVLK